MPIFEDVLWVHCGRQTEVNLHIDDERLEIRSSNVVTTTIRTEQKT